ncbi:MAG TPA: DCC1-like thiol-disulfide oxidoreductase family protein [Holophagaceae bacterium]|nr:DCC1-like thiol-disulfide oxidoreductase family protein [Holophagaceae bacterium]
MGRTPLILAYDVECSLCVKRADWIAARDTGGLLILFPLQHPELVKVAPELAGRPLHGELHGLDLATRKVLTGPALIPEILCRLPRWRLLAPLLRLPGLARLAAWLTLKRAERRFQRDHR